MTGKTHIYLKEIKLTRSTKRKNNVGMVTALRQQLNILQDNQKFEMTEKIKRLFNFYKKLRFNLKLRKTCRSGMVIETKFFCCPIRKWKDSWKTNMEGTSKKFMLRYKSLYKCYIMLKKKYYAVEIVPSLIFKTFHF